MPTDPLFRMTIEDIFSIKGRGTVVTGQVESGTLKIGDEVIIQGKSGEKKTTVTGIEMFRKMLDSAKAGDNVGILLRNISKDELQKGDLLLGQSSSASSEFTWKF